MARSKFVVCLLTGIVALVCAEAALLSAAETKPQSATILTVKKMCCGKESGPAIKELSKLPGVEKVTANHKARTLTIQPKARLAPSPKAMWDVAERLKIGPTRLATPTEVYTSKPRR
ncbi:MAG: cation transporter [Pirellulaceae bacterium]|nr:cation transporter [Pirellulaceae bacterium]